MTNLAEKLSTVLLGNLTRSFFCCTGSEANETALLIARLYTGKQEYINTTDISVYENMIIGALSK